MGQIRWFLLVDVRRWTYPLKTTPMASLPLELNKHGAVFFCFFQGLARISAKYELLVGALSRRCL